MTARNSSHWQAEEWRVLAIASVLQCAQNIDKLARSGTIDDAELGKLQEPLFVLNPTSNVEVYPFPSLFLPGLTLVESLGAGGSLRRVQLVVQYALGMLRLADAVRADAALAAALRTQIASLQPPRALASSQEHDGDEQTSTTRQLAQVYKATLSRLPKPIQVQGSAAVLSNEEHAAAIRSLLLAGVRSALFWRQLGGTRWQLLLARGKLGATASQLKKSIARSFH
ncbi:MAG: DUF489 family protein [Gammaproteobacteria bacterium]|jgi:high frequency lysogenization protein|nr:DUF489 family protein [Gammaproteobacteria bacterium]